MLAQGESRPEVEREGGTRGEVAEMSQVRKARKKSVKKKSVRKVRKNGCKFSKISYFDPKYIKNCPSIVIESPRR